MKYDFGGWATRNDLTCADGRVIKKDMTLMSVEQLGLTIEAYTYPNEFLGCIGKEELSPGVLISQQEHEHFGLSYRTLVGNDERGNDYTSKLWR